MRKEKKREHGKPPLSRQSNGSAQMSESTQFSQYAQSIRHPSVDHGTSMTSMNGARRPRTAYSSQESTLEDHQRMQRSFTASEVNGNGMRRSESSGELARLKAEGYGNRNGNGNGFGNGNGLGNGSSDSSLSKSRRAANFLHLGNGRRKD